MLDLHSKRGSVDLDWLASQARDAGASADTVGRIAAANTAAEALDVAASGGVALGPVVAAAARRTAADVLGESDVTLDIAIFSRDGSLVARL